MARRINAEFGEVIQFPVQTKNGLDILESICPVCSAPLLCEKTDKGFAVFCGREECQSIPANQGAEGVTVQLAVEALQSKLSHNQN